MKNEENFVKNLEAPGAEIVWQRNSPAPKWPATKLAAPKWPATKLAAPKSPIPS